jgi:quercetin dioxygenase-like cupin family protein
MPIAQLVSVLLIGGIATAACADGAPVSPEAANASSPEPLGALASTAELNSELPPPILIELLTDRHEFTDDVAVQIRLKPEGREREVVNLHDASRIAVLRITIQPGVRFPWHTHPGPTLGTVTSGELVYVYADDCIERQYPEGTAFVDPGFGNVHFAFNPTEGETVIIATFLGVPATGPLTIPVTAAEGDALDAKCGFAPAS